MGPTTIVSIARTFAVSRVFVLGAVGGRTCGFAIVRVVLVVMGTGLPQPCYSFQQRKH